MEFRFETVYDQAACAAMAKAVRKTLRKKRNRRSHIFGIIVIVFALLLTLPLGRNTFSLDGRTVFTWVIVLVLLVTLIFEDQINGYTARKRLLAGTEKSFTVFHRDSYRSETALGVTEFKYDGIQAVVETMDYFVFVFSQSHAQVYQKGTISGGTVAEFRAFLAEAAEKTILQI